MNFAPEQKEEFRQLISQAAASVELIESRAGLDQFDSELVSEVIHLDELNASLQSALLRGFIQVVPGLPIAVDVDQQLINEEYTE